MGNLILRQNGVLGRVAPSLSTILAQGTATGLRISSADGVALLDNCPSAITDLVALYPGKLNILILDASNRVIEGWAGSVGTGEGYLDIMGGSDPGLLNGNMETGDPPTGWYAMNSAVLSQQSDERTGGAGSKSIQVLKSGVSAPNARRSFGTISNNGLFFLSAWVKSTNTGYYSTVAFGAAFGGYNAEKASDVNWANMSAYKTSSATTGNVSLVSYATNDGHGSRFDDITIRQVTAPSALGCTIVSTFEGAEQSWTSDDGINPNSLTFDIDITNS